ncbi:hypothetical protein RCL_jg16936.t1 [Rhizophagus clarus]|uniref:Uncharacterized protein n=1 Tax=Rhizophagus clarus TaxID=94130 RepID=A0A8H3QQA8_9GLOM|nr:hypothetical protein RCL_jg16936.t1 [Rhizophagus clarus]
MKINNFNLLKNTRYVDTFNWDKYFRFYTGKVFTYAHVGSLDINNADKRNLKLVKGVSSNQIDAIYSKRKFEDIEDVYNKIKIPMSKPLKTELWNGNLNSLRNLLKLLPSIFFSCLFSFLSFSLGIVLTISFSFSLKEPFRVAI